ncbi:hypothetical protein K5Y72_003058 [Escherichia coli]|nr:hypothetical protein [Escherichia coli]
MKIDYQELRKLAEIARDGGTYQEVTDYRSMVTPEVVLTLLDEIKKLEDTNIDAMCQIAELKTNIKLLKKGVANHD